MSKTLTADDARQSLTEHLTHKGGEILGRFGAPLDWDGLQRLLADRTQVRYPCEIVFDAAPLQAGEFAHPEPRGEEPDAGFTMVVHPAFEKDLARVPALVLYQLVAVNYGEFASADDAECFGAAALGLTRDEYYALLCEASDLVGGGAMDEAAADVAETLAGGCGGGCSCGGE